MKKILFIIIFSVAVFVVHAAEKRQRCTIDGQTNVLRYSIWTYSVVGSGGCSAIDWSVKNATTVSTSTNSRTIKFDSFGLVTIKAWYANGSSVDTAKVSFNVTAGDALSPGSMASPDQTINYNETAQVSCTLPSHQTTIDNRGQGYSYQWLYCYASTGTFLPIPGEIGQNLSKQLTRTTYFKRQVTSDYQTAYSDIAVVKVLPYPGTITPNLIHVYYNKVPAPITIGGVAGGDGRYTYQWQSSPDQAAWTNMTGQVGTTYSPGPSTKLTYYRVLVATTGLTAASQPATIQVYPPLYVGPIGNGPIAIPYNGSVTLEDDDVFGGDGDYSYEWFWATDTTLWHLAGTERSYNTGSLTTDHYYKLTIKSSGQKITTPKVKVVVLAPGVFPGDVVGGFITTVPLTIDAGMDHPTLRATPALEGHCNGKYSYLWEKSTDGNSFLSTGVTTQDHTPSNINGTTYYRRKVTCDNETAYTNTVAIRVWTGNDLNYVKTRHVTVKDVKSRDNADALSNLTDVIQSTQYIDGLGRPVQTVVKQGSPSHKDLTTIRSYDAFDRETVHMLPFSSDSTGDLNTKPYLDQASFNEFNFPGEQYFYSQSIMEGSPLNRPITNYSPGISWRGSDRGVSTSYRYNLGSDSVRQWNVDAYGNLVAMGNYPHGRLFKNITTDEEHNSVIEFKDQEDKVILKKVQSVPSAGSGHKGWACTYYVYDDDDNLVVVLPPEAVKRIIQP